MSQTNTKKTVSYGKFATVIIFILVAMQVVSTPNSKQSAMAGEITQTAITEYKEFKGEEVKVEAVEVLDDPTELERVKTVEPVAEVKVVEPVAEVKAVDNWKPFTDHAKNNPWRGATFYGKNHLQIAKENQPKYENIAGCHPYLLMAIHYTETGLQFQNGANGQGAFQAYSSGIRYVPNSPVTDFKEQATRACNHIRGKVGGADLSNIEDVNLIGKALALYNGCYSPAFGIYARGNFGSPDGWDKCPYTSNFLQSNEGMLQCATDGCATRNQRRIYGTMAFIAHLKIN
jgi:hypothetical protein